MEKLKLNLSPIDGGIRFRIHADQYGGKESSLPFSDGNEDSNLFTVLNALNTFDSRYEHREGNDEDWMVRQGILYDDKRFFHQNMRKNIGQKLYEALFPDTIRDTLNQKIGQAGSEEDLHLQIQYDADAIQQSRLSLYPWQLVNNGQEFLAKRRVIFSYLIAHRNSLPEGRRRVRQIKVLLISSTASEEDNQGLQNIELIIRNGLTQAEERGCACLLNWDESSQQRPTYQRLSDYLTDNINDIDRLPDIIHFNGHGVFKKQCTNPLCSRQGTNEVFYSRNENRCTFCGRPLSEPKGFLLFEDDEGNPDYISAERFANLVSISRFRPALVVITACRSALAHQSESVFNGIAQSVLREVPAVVATPFNISADSTIVFVEQFYRALGAKQSLLKAVKLASQAMHYYDYEWYRPVIFLRHQGDEDGYLFEFEEHDLPRKLPREDNPQPDRRQALPLELELFDFQVITVNERGRIIREEPQQARQYTEILPQEVELEMVYIPGGTFMMGAPEDENGSRIDEKPQVQITLEPFFMAKYPITQQQWFAIASASRIDRGLVTAPSWFSRQRDSNRRPVELVNWDEAVEFCKRLSRDTGREYKLPSEAQWEYACRAGTITPFHFGETIPIITNSSGSICELVNLNFHINQTTPVGTFPPNAFGLYDMHGNVWEWCCDNYKNRNHNPCIRGGSWGTPREDCRSASRLEIDLPEDCNSYKGFRVICNV